MVTALATALNYINRGWNPVPVDFRSKKPSGGNGWQLRIIDANNAAQHFNGRAMNIGVMLGPSSHGLTDVDLDCDEALHNRLLHPAAHQGHLWSCLKPRSAPALLHGLVREYRQGGFGF
jgi:hypothetical protein